MQGQVRLAWGREGAAEAASRGDLLVVVDVMRFSSAASLAIAAGHEVWPVATDEEAARLAEELGSACRVGRQFLSPHMLDTLTEPTSLVLATPNGATCCALGAQAPLLLVGALVNSRAVAQAVVAELARGTAPAVTVLACGERHPEDTLRVALEDELGAGAILARLPAELGLNAEARAAAATFLALQGALEALLLECETGLELLSKGRTRDIQAVARLDSVDAVPVLIEGRLVRWKTTS